MKVRITGVIAAKGIMAQSSSFAKPSVDPDKLYLGRNAFQHVLMKLVINPHSDKLFLSIAIPL